MSHPTVTLTAPDAHGVEIDVDIAPLIEALWQLGVRTVESCQESQPGFVWIAFANAADALDFLRAVDLTDDALDGVDVDDYDLLINRALNPIVASAGGSRPDAWQWRWTGLP